MAVKSLVESLRLGIASLSVPVSFSNSVGTARRVEPPRDCEGLCEGLVGVLTTLAHKGGCRTLAAQRTTDEEKEGRAGVSVFPMGL